MGPAKSPSNLHTLLHEQRDRLIACWGERIKGIADSAALPTAELLDHMPDFVEELILALYPESLALPARSTMAREHGHQRLRLGFDVAQVVREYGALHECILQLADEAGLTVALRDQVVVVKWLNAGVANAVAQYVKERDAELQRQSSEHLGFIAHELRNPLGTARLAFHRLRGVELANSRTADVLERSLTRTSEMIDSVLSHASLRLGVAPKLAPLALRPLLDEIAADAAIEGKGKDIVIVVAAADDLHVDADVRLLRSAISNLVHNAVKFSHEGARAIVSAGRSEGRVLVEVADACGGLPPGKVEELFTPLVQRGENRSGFGLGLSIALQAVEAHHGTIKVRDVPGTGCTFVIDLPGGTAG